MLVQSISKIKNNKIQNNTGYKESSQKTVNNMTLPSFADAKSFVNMSFKAAIHDYAVEGNLEGVEKVLQRVNVNSPDAHGETALMLAIIHNRMNVAEKLLQHPDIDVNVKNKNGNTALIWASYRGDAKVVEKLLEHHDIDVNAQNEEGDTALIWASYHGHTKVVEKLLEHHDIDVNAQNEEGDTALIWASCHGHTKVVEKLLEHPGVDIGIKDDFGRDALSLANDEIAQMIKNYKRGVDRREEVNKTQISKSVSDINLQDDDGNTSLIRASRNGNIDEVEKLLQHPDIDVNVKNKHGNTALIWASYRGDAKVVEKLLEHHDIDVNAQNEEGDTALTWACSNKCTKVVKQLMKHPDIDVNIQDDCGNTALMRACYVKDVPAVEVLLRHPGVDINLKNFDGKVALDYANDESAQMIKNYKRGVDKRVIEVVQGGNRKDSEGTVAEVNKPDKNGNTPLMRASIFKNMDKLDELLKDPEVDVNARGAIGCTALMCASNIGNRNAEVVEKLLQHPDINVNAQSSSGWTALHWACNNNYEKVVEKLLEHPDIDVNIKDGNGREASSFANDEIVQMIKNYRRGVDKRAKVLPRVFDFNKLVSSKEFSTEEIENAVRRSVTKKIREEERIKANKKVEDKIVELDKTKAEYEEKNKALDNLINDYNSMLADDVEDAKSGFRTLYGVKSENLPEKMDLGEQMIYVIDIMSNNRNKLSNMNSDSPEKITKALQDNNGQISADGLKFLERVIKISDRSCSEDDLISSINAVKDKSRHIDMKKVSYFIANLSWGQSTIPEVIQKVEQYAAKNN